MSNLNDPFDEFEFKPLTEGLGFHKKSSLEFKNSHLTFENSEASIPSNSISLENRSSEATKTFEISKQTAKNKHFNLNSPLPRPEFKTQPASSTGFNQTSGYQPHLSLNSTARQSINIPTIEDDSISKAQSAVNEILKTLNQKKQQEETLQKQSKKLIWKNSTPSIAAGFLDSMLIAAFFLLSLIAMLAITQVDLVANINNPDQGYTIYWATLLLLAGLQMIYFVSCRTFLGFTPGEWAFDQRCGSEIQQASATYAARVALRSLINMTTGFILAPVISLIVRFDVLAPLTGLQVQQQKTI